MHIDHIQGRLTFLQEAERLKSVLRSAHTSTGRAESTAEHTWRLCLMAMCFADQLAGLDMHDRARPLAATFRPWKNTNTRTKARKRKPTCCS